MIIISFLETPGIIDHHEKLKKKRIAKMSICSIICQRKLIDQQECGNTDVVFVKMTN